MLVLVLIIVCAVAFYIRFRHMRKHLYKVSEILPCVGELPVIGHTHWFIGGPEKLLNNIKELAELIDSSGGSSKVWIGPSLYFVTLNPDDVQKILENCLEKDMSYKFLKPWLGEGLFIAPVDLWKIQRRTLLPIFHNKILDEYLPVFGQQSAILVELLEKQVGKPEFDIYKFITSCMLDIVFETAMGEKMDVQHNPDTPYLRARNCVMSIINMRMFKAWLQPDALFKLTPYAKVQQENIDYTHKFTDEVVTKKQEQRTIQDQNKEVKKDLLELIMNREMQFTNKQLREQIESITIAGNDTTALVVSYALLLLGSHEEVQDKVVDELNSIFGESDRIPTKEDINKMNYLELVLKETMRMYTVTPVIARKTQKEIKLSNFTLPAGVGCAIVPLVMHRSKRLWGPTADCFDPDRFLPENSVHRHPCAYIPFSYGTRNCIGRNFGMTVMKSVLAMILRVYKIRSKAINRFKIEILMFPVPGHMVTIEKRKKN